MKYNNYWNVSVYDLNKFLCKKFFFAIIAIDIKANK